MSKEFLNHVELTSQPVESKLKTQGNFMENSGGQDGLRPVEPRETSRTNQPNSPFTESSIERVDPSAKEEIVRLVGDIEKKPLEKWTEKEILDRWVQLQASLGGASGTSTFTGALVGELARRNGEEPSQLTDIFDNLFKAAEESETGSDPFVLRANMDDEPPYIPPGGPPIPPMGPNLPPPDDPWWQGVSEDEKVRIINDFNWERSPIEQRIARANEVVRDIITGEAGRRLDTLQREVAGYTTEREASRAAGHEIRDLEREARFVNEIRRYLAQYPVPEAYGVDVRLLELASHFEELGEELINRIIFKAYEDENETNPYDASMNLYAQSNLDTLLGYLSHRYKDRYKFYISLKTAAGNFHRMNASANSGDLDSFIRIAELINYKQFSLMQKINGAPRVMRLFETKYQQYLGRDGRITSQNYEQLIKDVQRSFEMLNNNGALRSEFTDDREGNSRKLEEWEVARALNVGRIFFNITFRPAEMVASGRVPREGDQSEQKAASFPFEQAAKLMNFIQRGMYRFETGESRGAMKWIVMIKKAYQDYLRSIQKKRGINQYLIIGGMNVNELEAGAMFGASGVLSGWRIENLSYTEIKVSENMTLRQWLDGETRGYKGEMIPRYMRIKEIKGRVKEKIEKNPKANISQEENELLELVNPIIGNLEMGIGALLKQMFEGNFAYKVRQRLWERAAEVNLPTTISMLSQVVKWDSDPSYFVDEKGEYKDTIKYIGRRENLIESLRNADITNWDEEIEGQTKWEILMDKIIFNHEVRMQNGLSGRHERIQVPENMQFDFNERRLIGQIIAKGKELAPHLADIVFPYLPFANDLPYEDFNYQGPGEEFFRRRAGSDLGGYYSAEQAFDKIIKNIGGLDVKEIIGDFTKIIAGIEGPNGSADAQERVFPMFKAWMQLIIAQPGYRHSVIKGMREFLRQPTSLAQGKEFAGIKAASLDPFQAGALVDEAQRMGIIPEGLARKLKKGEKILIGNLIWMLFKEFFYLPFLVGGVEIAREGLKEAA